MKGVPCWCERKEILKKQWPRRPGGIKSHSTCWSLSMPTITSTASMTNSLQTITPHSFSSHETCSYSLERRFYETEAKCKPKAFCFINRMNICRLQRQSWDRIFSNDRHSDYLSRRKSELGPAVQNFPYIHWDANYASFKSETYRLTDWPKKKSWTVVVWHTLFFPAIQNTTFIFLKVLDTHKHSLVNLT